MENIVKAGIPVRAQDLVQYNSYLGTAPTSGSMDQDVTWGTLTENEGRDNRGPINAKYVSDNNPSLAVTLEVIQKGKPIFIDVVEPRNCSGNVIGIGATTYKTITARNTGETLVVNLRSNAKKLYYYTDNTNIPSGYNPMQFATLPNTYTVNGQVTATNNSNIVGDPGKTSYFTASLQLTILENESIESKAGIFYIVAYDDNNNYCTYVINIKQEKAEEYLWIGKPESTEAALTLEYNSGDVGVQTILSNGNWHLVM